MALTSTAGLFIVFCRSDQAEINFLLAFISKQSAAFAIKIVELFKNSLFFVF